MTELKLDGLNCANCAAEIEKTLKHNEFLTDVSFSFATKKLVVSSDLRKEKLQDLIQKEVDKIEQGVTVGFESEGDEAGGVAINDFLRSHGRTIIGALLFFSLLIFDMPSPYLNIAYAISYLLIGGDVVWRALRNIARGRLFDENFLMTVATIGAFALGELNEAVAVMLFYKTGEGFQQYAVDQSRRSIKSLLNIKAEYANRITEGKTEKITPEELEIGDMIVVRNGEKVPVDGILIEGSSSFDTSALTGESLPRHASEGTEILSGYINKEAPVTLKVLREFSNSAVSKILHMVENAAARKAKTEQFITKFAHVYTPIVVSAAAILAFAPPLLGLGPFREWISRALIFLVISCPCALVLSVPLGFFGGLGSASRKGILVKGGNYLEALNGIDAFVFDKTGTLTMGNFAVEKVDGDETLELAALLEQHSNHPIALSIMKAYGKSPDPVELKDLKEISGQGMRGLYRDKELLAGNERLLKEQGISLPQTEYAGTLIHVAYDGEYKGFIGIKDEIKPSARKLSEKLKALGARSIVMLTGDRRSIAEDVARELAIDDCRSELLPEDKLAHVEKLIAQGHKVLFAGDGINDAPVLARAHIGVAMGGLGSDAAIEAADMVLMTDEPSKLIEAMDTAKKTRKIVLQNIVFALAVKLFFLTMGAFGMATMYEAVFADVGVALIAVLNSMRILRN